MTWPGQSEDTNRQFDGLLGGHSTELRHQTAVQSAHSFVADDLAEAVPAALVHEFSYQ